MSATENTAQQIVRHAEAPPKGEVGAASNLLGGFTRLFPYNPDDLVRSKGSGLKIYQEMLREPYIKAALMQKKTKLLKIGWDIIPASKEPQDIEIAAFVKWNLSTNLAGAFTRDIYEMLDALDNGFSISEKIWDTVATGRWKSKTALANIKSKDPWYFDFATDKYGNLGPNGLILKNSAIGGTKKRLPVNKFVIFSYLMRYENHYGSSDLRAAYRAFWLKDTAWKLRAIYMERYSGNNLKGTYPKNDADAKKALLEIFSTWQQETGIALPEGVDVEVLNLATSSKSEYEATINDCNREIQIGILGQTLTMDVGAKGTGSRALGQVHDGVRDDFVTFLDEIIATEVNLQIVRPIVDYNYDTDSYPSWGFKSREGFDGEAFSRTLQNLAGVGDMDIPVKWVKERYRIPEPEKGQSVLRIDNSPAPIPAKLAEPRPPTPDARDPRPFTALEKKAGLPRIARETAALIEKAKDASTPLYGAIFANILKQVEKKAILESGDYEMIEKVAANVGEIKALLTSTLIEARLTGHADIRALPAVKAPVKLAEEFTPDAALRVLAKKAGLTKSQFAALANEMKGQAITVAGLEKATIEKEIKALLFQAIKNGDDIKAFKHNLNEAAIKYSQPVYAAVGAVGDTILDFHAETIFRTNIMDAYNAGRKDALLDPDVKESFPAWQISEVLDGRTRQNHASATGLTFMADDPVWSRLTPPNGYNCRAVLIPINLFDFERDQLSSAGDIPADYPDPGFG